MILIAATAPLMPTYEARLGTDGALADQRSAAALMWVDGDADDAAAARRSRVWRWAAAEERIARQAEALTDAAALTNQR